MFPAGSLDLIYSIGVIGEYSPIGPAELRLFRQLLKPDGILFVTAVDALSKVAVPENDQPSFRRRIARKLFPHLPGAARRLLNRRLSPFYVSRVEIDSLFADSGFSRTEIKPYVHSSGWRGTHFDCLAWR